jgi:hypothetical protein
MGDPLAHSTQGYSQQGAYSPHPHIPMDTIQASIMATGASLVAEESPQADPNFASFLNEDPN